VIYKRDLRHAYRQFQVDPSDYKYLGYYWEDRFFIDSVLCMGQRNAAMACSRITKSIMHIHLEDGYEGTSNDDLIGVAEESIGIEAYESLGNLLKNLGLLENFEKACPPSVIQVVLGVLIDTMNMLCAVPPERMKEILELLRIWKDKARSTKVELQRLIGKLQYVTQCVYQSRIFLNRLLETLRTIKSDKTIKLSTEFKKEIRWWTIFMGRYNGVSFIPSFEWSQPDVTFATDSCLVGCGGVCNKEYFHVSFPVWITSQNLPIHCLEMLAVLVGVRTWGKNCRGKKIQIFCDNIATVQVINSSKTRDTFMATCLRELWLEVCTFEFELRAVHLPGDQNRIPDWLSRWDCDSKYRDLFKEFIADDGPYFDIFIPEKLFEFSKDL
jgi:hypothetical protein